MDLTSRLQGYLNHEIAYPNPIPSLSVPRTLHDKKDTTLLEMALKAFVKERLFGRFNIYDRENKQNSNHLVSNQEMRGENSRSISVINKNASNHKNLSKRENNVSMFSEMSHAYLTQNAKTKIIRAKHQKEEQNAVKLQKRRLSQISSSFDFKPKGLTQTKSLANSHVKIKQKNLTRLQQSFNLKNDENVSRINFNQEEKIGNYEDHHGTSFISAIDYYEKERPSAFDVNSGEKFKLPDINDKRRNVSSKLQIPKNPKTFNKKQTFPQVSINDELWLFLSKQKQQRIRKVRQSKSPQSVVSISKLVDKIDQTKNASILRNTDAGLLSKETFQSFLNNSKLSITFFMIHVFNFFEYMGKIMDKSKRVDFEACFSNLYNLPDRAWSVAMFRFFDTNSDGKIDSSDLFKIHNLLEEIIEKVQNFKANPGLQASLNQSVQFKKKTQKRQSTQMSQNESYMKNDRQKTKGKQKTDESEKLSQESYQVLANFMNRNLENAKTFQKFIQQLNSRFMQKDRSKSRNLDLYNPQNEQDNKNKSKQKATQQIRYLQEALLKNKDLKISDLSLILEEMTYQNSKAKKKVIDIDYKKMNIKLSSSYVQTFIATNHNEETRMNREHLESLKDSLKGSEKSAGQNNHLYEAKQLPSLKYTEFYEEKLFMPVKNMFFQCLHSEVTEFK